jgi:hypothetical protein
LKKREGESQRGGGYLLVKSRPRQKLPRQSSTAQRLDTPPSPPFLQFMAAADDSSSQSLTFSRSSSSAWRSRRRNKKGGMSTYYVVVLGSSPLALAVSHARSCALL